MFRVLFFARCRLVSTAFYTLELIGLPRCRSAYLFSVHLSIFVSIHFVYPSLSIYIYISCFHSLPGILVILQEGVSAVWDLGCFGFNCVSPAQACSLDAGIVSLVSPLYPKGPSTQ